MVSICGHCTKDSLIIGEALILTDVVLELDVAHILTAQLCAPPTAKQALVEAGVVCWGDWLPVYTYILYVLMMIITSFQHL